MPGTEAIPDDTLADLRLMAEPNAMIPVLDKPVLRLLLDCYERQHYAVSDTTAADRAELIRRATAALYRATNCQRWGPEAQQFAHEAADLLDRAGLHETADRCRDEWGAGLTDALNELWEMGR